MSRPDRIHTNLKIAQVMAQRGTCLRAKVGAVATVDGRIVSTGYNGAIKGQSHCTSESCTPHDHCPNSVHAEANLIAYAAKKGMALEGATIYVTHSPCVKCSELIIQSGIKHVFYAETYRDTNFELLMNSGITVNHFPLNED